MKTIKIFLASSINDLHDERMEISSFVCCTLQKIFGDSVKLELEMCENDSGTVSKERKQDEYNRYICESDYLFIMFWHNAGEFTVEEFRTAYEHFKKTDKPHIIPFVKLLPAGDRGTEELARFLGYMRDELQHYYLEFRHVDTVKLRILLALARDPDLHMSVELRDAQVMVNSRELTDENHQASINVENIPFYRNHEGIHRLREEVACLEEQKTAARMAVAEDPNDSAARALLYKVSARWNQLREELHKYEMQLLETSMCLTKLTTDGTLVTARTKKAIDLFEEGKLDGALDVLDMEAFESDLRLAEEIAARNRAQMEALVKELTTRIDILTAQGLTDRTTAEIGRLYERVKSITLEHGLGLKCVQKYMNYLNDRGDRDYAFRVGEQLYHLYKSREDTDELDWAEFCGDLACLYQEKVLSSSRVNTEDAAKAEELLNEALSIYRPVAVDLLLMNRLKLIWNAYRLANLHVFLNRYDEAEPLYKEALEHSVYLEKLVPSTMGSVIALTKRSLANVYKATGRFDSSEELYLEAMAEYRRLDLEKAGEHDASLATVCHELAELYRRHIQRYQRAEELYREALMLRRRLAAVNPSKHELDVATTCRELAMLYHGVQRYTDAEELFKESYRIYNAHMQQNKARSLSGLSTVCAFMAELYIDIYCVNSAERLLLDAVAGFHALDELTGSDHIHAVKTLQVTQQQLHRKMKTMTEKEQELAFAVSISHRLLEQDVTVFDTGLGKNYFYLFNIYRDSGRLKEADETREAMARDAVFAYGRLAETEPARYRIKYADACYYLAELLSGRDETYRDGVGLYLDAAKAYKAQEEELNDTSMLRYATACYEAAMALMEIQTDETAFYGLAETLFREAYLFFERVKDMDPDARAVSMMLSCYHLGVVNENLDRDAPADACYDRALEIAAAYKDVNPECADLYEKLRD